MGFFDHDGVLLRFLFHRVDRAVDFLQTDRLLARRSGDRLQYLTGVTDQPDAVADLDRRFADLIPDLRGLLGRPLRETSSALADAIHLQWPVDYKDPGYRMML